jgi:hypothetical protein
LGTVRLDWLCREADRAGARGLYRGVEPAARAEAQGPVWHTRKARRRPVTPERSTTYQPLLATGTPERAGTDNQASADTTGFRPRRVTSFLVTVSGCDELLGARPGLHTLGALDRVEPFREGKEVGLRLLQPCDLGIDLRHSPPQKLLRVTARTETAIADVEKFLDLLETQSDALPVPPTLVIRLQSSLCVDLRKPGSAAIVQGRCATD